MKRKRTVYSIYLYDEEVDQIKMLSKRITPGEKAKPVGQVVRRAVLAVAANPDLDFIFDPGVCLKLTREEILLRQKLFVSMKENIELLKRHGIELSSLEEGGAMSGSKYETDEEDS